MSLRTGIIIALLVAGVGLLWLYLAMVGPLQTMNIGFGLATGLAATKLPGGYNMANVVLFLIFAVILVLGGMYFFRSKKTS
jgi:hypothetical protein